MYNNWVNSPGTDPSFFVFRLIKHIKILLPSNIYRTKSIEIQNAIKNNNGNNERVTIDKNGKTTTLACTTEPNRHQKLLKMQNDMRVHSFDIYLFLYLKNG